MKVYIATALNNYAAAQALSDKLEASGHEVTSSWHRTVMSQAMDRVVGDPDNACVRRDILSTNLFDLAQADAVVALTPTTDGKATYCEIGWAIASWKPVIWLGRAGRCIFDAHANVTIVNDVERIHTELRRIEFEAKALEAGK